MRLYINKRPNPTLYLGTSGAPALILKSDQIVDLEELTPEAMKAFRSHWLRKVIEVEPYLYLEIDKANSVRDPSHGQYISGGAHKSKPKDMSEVVNDLMSKLPGEKLDKKDE